MRGRLGAADYAPRLLAPETKNFFFQEKKFFSKKQVFSKEKFFSDDSLFSNKNLKKKTFQQKSFTLIKMLHIRVRSAAIAVACYAFRKICSDLFCFTSEPCIRVGVRAAMPTLQNSKSQ